MSTNKTTSKIALPAGIQSSDLAWPKDYEKERVDYDKCFDLYYVDAPGFLTGWVIPTLKISKGKQGRADRSYGITLDGRMVRVGNGPHVKSTVKVIVTNLNQNRLEKYLAIKDQGEEKAHITRDARSSRRLNSRSSWGF